MHIEQSDRANKVIFHYNKRLGCGAIDLSPAGYLSVHQRISVPCAACSLHLYLYICIYIYAYIQMLPNL